MSKYIFTIETENEDELTPYTMATKMHGILWDLKHNFWRKWKHVDGSEEYLKGVTEVLDDLQEELKEYKEDEWG